MSTTGIVSGIMRAAKWGTTSTSMNATVLTTTETRGNGKRQGGAE
jgi:hypothetical protein